ncbi:MAG: beta-glucosidase [Bacteroidetes bacterium]|nr:MAG: beta-glucosidase [Bacteroidota bacterium]
MTQVSADVVLVGEPYNIELPYKIDPDKLHRAVVEYGVGSILNVPTGDLPDLARWRHLITAIQEKAQETRLKIPVLYGFDAIHGCNYIEGATMFPQPLATAATWNPELARAAAEVTAYETRAAGLTWNFSPAMDVGRNPEWPRFWESFGEDVFMNKTMGLAVVQGYQGDDPADKYRVAACLKHFTGYGMPFSGKDRTPIILPENMLREYYLPQYKACIDAGALTIMVNSGEINGTPVHADKHILTDILRGELGFQGLLVTDWADIEYLHTRHKVAPTMKDAVRMAVEAGIDMSMTPMSLEFADILVELVEEGTIPESRIDESVRRILRVKKALGLFDQPYYPQSEYGDFASEASRQLSLEAARESIVLLKNEDQTLPLPASAKILVTGPTAHTMRSLNGGWTCSWQGDNADECLAHKHTILEGLQDRLGAGQVSYVPGATFDSLLDVRAAVRAARRADYVVLCLGELSYTEDWGNLNDMDLPRAQIELAEALIATGKPVILVLAEGRPRVFRPIEPGVSAVVAAFYPGPEGGDALADVLTGAVNPSGKLPFTYPKYSNSLVPYDHKYTEDREMPKAGKSFDPQYPFGHGLSYTTFGYAGLSLSQKSYQPTDTIVVRVQVQNTGSRAGKEVVQVYVSDLYASITPPVRRLRAFRKVALEAGETKEVTFEIPVSELAFVNAQNEWVLEPGDFILEVGGLQAPFSVSE